MAKGRGPHPHSQLDEFGVIWIPSDPDIDIQYKVVGADWRAMAELVGGYVEILRRLRGGRGVNLDCGCPLIMALDEDGLMKGLDINPRASMISGHLTLVGDVFLIGEGPVAGPDGVQKGFVTLTGSNSPSLESIRQLSS